MTSSLDLEDPGSWLHGLEGAFAELELTGEDEVAALAADISKNMRDAAPSMDEEERARRLAQPKGRSHVRKTPGRRTIRYVRGHDRQGFYVDVGPNKAAFYLAFIEYGTRWVQARPFLRPAIEKAVAAWGTAGSRSHR